MKNCLKLFFLPVALSSLVSTLTVDAADVPGKATAYDLTKMQREHLGRGLIATRCADGSVAVGWRFFSSDADDAAFDVYRNGVKVNAAPIVETSMVYDTAADPSADNVYVLKLNGKDDALASFTLKANSPVGYLPIPIDIPAPGTTPMRRHIHV